MTFDELFNDFFSGDEEIKKDAELDNKIQQISDFIKKNISLDSKDVGNKANLIKVEIVKIDGVKYEKTTWDINGTILVKLGLISEEPDMEKLLEKAVDEENYEEAARLRDLIKKNESI
jgi:hypothetical protein